MRVITTSELVRNALKAYRERRLQAQVQPGTTKCLYQVPDKPDCGCAIGVSLQPDEMERVLKVEAESGPIGAMSLPGTNIVLFTDPRIAAELQVRHDEWAKVGEVHPELRTVKEGKFIEFLQEIAPEEADLA